MASAFDRACELFAAIKGFLVDYGEEHAAEHQVMLRVRSAVSPALLRLLCSMLGLAKIIRGSGVTQSGLHRNRFTWSGILSAGILSVC